MMSRILNIATILLGLVAALLTCLFFLIREDVATWYTAFGTAFVFLPVVVIFSIPCLIVPVIIRYKKEKLNRDKILLIVGVMAIVAMIIEYAIIRPFPFCGP